MVAGIDVGSEFNYAGAFDWRGIEYSKKPFKFRNTEPGFAEFRAWILHIQTEHDKEAAASAPITRPMTVEMAVASTPTASDMRAP